MTVNREYKAVKKTIYFILKDDLVYYPPVLSILKVSTELGWHAVFIGNYADDMQKKQLEAKGVLFKPTVKMSDTASMPKKLIEKLRFRTQVYKYLNELAVTASDYVWLFHSETLCLLHKLVERYRVIYHPLEFTLPKADWKYRLLSHSLNLSETVRQACKVVCCEYNRAQMTKGIFALDKLPYVLPNKMYVPDEEESRFPVRYPETGQPHPVETER